jgi:hypothetical protein
MPGPVHVQVRGYVGAAYSSFSTFRRGRFGVNVTLTVFGPHRGRPYLRTAGSWLRSSDSSTALRSHSLRPLESVQSTWAPAMPSSAATACRGHPRAAAPSASVLAPNRLLWSLGVPGLRALAISR